jgi:hypothetical protein
MELFAPLERDDKELVECQSCGLTSDPRSLPCHHSYDLSGIRQRYVENILDDDVHNTRCRAKVPLPAEEDLSNGSFPSKLTAGRKVDRQTTNIVPCDGCWDDVDSSASRSSASGYCTYCCQVLCNSCSKPHQRIPGGRHVIVPFDNDDGLEPCIVCNCNLDTCKLCFDQRHQGSKCRDVSDACEEFREYLESDIVKVSTRKNDISEEMKRLESKQRQFEDETHSVRKAIEQIATEMKACIDEIYDQLEQKLLNSMNSLVKFIENEKSLLGVSLKKSEEYLRHIRKLLDGGKPAHHVKLAYSALHKQTGELLKQTCNADICVPEILISPTDAFNKMYSYISEKMSSE